MPGKHTEARFEDAIFADLTGAGGYRAGSEADYDRALALEPATVLGFIADTQPKPWAALRAIHGEHTGRVVLASLDNALETQGMLGVLRHGFKCYGRALHVAWFAPNNRMNPDTLALYARNQLSVTRQLHFSVRDGKSLDLVLFLNGLPIATAELKNPLTGQTAADARRQYKQDRDPAEPLFAFKRRALVHFAVDPEQVFMTTRLSGRQTRFLPFNRGRDGGAGNPEAADGGYRSGYLWREVWARDSLLEILGRFMHLQVEDKRVVTDQGIKRIRKEVMIFPRYHQLQAVRALVGHAREHGAGRNYLVQHSAGSGKSNSIAWLAHRLAHLHDAQDQRVFDSVIVITDRRVLDQQLQDTIYQFEHKKGVVEKIDQDTRQLVRALNSGTPIVVSTLQKFAFVTETADKLAEQGEDGIDLATLGKRFAVIVDEAHSSQSGEAAMDVKQVLNRDGIAEAAARYAEENDDEGRDGYEEIVRQMLKRGRQPNLSFFAFTATPKYKTKQVFDEPGPTGAPPFHLYSMKQAIQEEFILDVLAHYTSYETYYRIAQSTQDDPDVDRRKAAQALARFLTLHPVNIQQKTEVMVEHFRQHVRHKIGGRAKAMVVTSSRLHAVRYKLAFDEYIGKQGYRDIRTLVAFSGTVTDPDVPDKTYTEVGMNGGLSERELPAAFDGEEYRLLLVADKYQTGFDQPLLHTMYVDKRLAGVQAVQTLSRLNRTCAGKEDTFVLDFRNTREEIFAAFKDYYIDTPVEPLTDPHELYRLQHRIEAHAVIHSDEIEAFRAVYFLPKRYASSHDHERMNAILAQAVERFEGQDEESREEFRGLATGFVNLYGFLSQVIPYQDSDLESLYTYLRFLRRALPRRAAATELHLDEDVRLEYYRLQKISEGRIDLSVGEARPLKGPGDVGTGQVGDELIRLSELVRRINERFGTDFTEADQLFFDQIQQEALEDAALIQAGRVNSEDDFRLVWERAFEGLVIDRMEGNEEIFSRLMADRDFRDFASDHLLRRVYRALRASPDAGTQEG